MNAKVTHTLGPWYIFQTGLARRDGNHGSDFHCTIGIKKGNGTFNKVGSDFIEQNDQVVFAQVFGSHIHDSIDVSSVFHRIEIEEAQANARLIVASPDLFEALKAALQIIEQLIPEPSVRGVAEVVLFQGRAAIAKATGVQS